MKKIIGKLDRKEDFWFVSVYWNKHDFYVPKKFIWNFKTWDIVEIEVLGKKKWKNKEARIIKVIEDKNLLISEEWNIIWVYSENDRWFWFVDVEWISKWFFVYSWNKSNAMDGDVVEARIKTFKNKKEAEIIRVVERKKRTIVWIFEKWKKDFSFVIPKNKNYKNDIFVLDKNSMDAENWYLVWIEITKWDKKNPEWKVVEILSKDWKMDKREESIITLALEAGVNVSFNDKLIKELNKIDSEINFDKEKNRKDLRRLFTFTIDSIDAKDLDDAVSIEKLDNGDFKLYVHIADVSHYVKENSEIDREALDRWTSVYLADRVIPMLPQKLSNDLCSLNPNTDKLTLTCEMLIWWKTWHIIKTKIYESILNTDFRMTYKDIDEILDWKLKLWDNSEFWQKITGELLEKVKNSEELKNKVLNFREKTWILNFNFKETYIKFDEKWEVVWIEEFPRYSSNKIIEVFMVSANESVAKEFVLYPFLYRIHEKPKDDDFLELLEKLNLFWIKFKLKENNPKDFADLIEEIKKLDEWKKMFLQKIVLRSLSEAKYSENNLWHFWLWLKYYSHFTSPIRRYPDLQIHRIIKELINNKEDKKSLKKDRLVHYKSILPRVAIDSNKNEKRAEKLEYKVRDYFIVEFYKNKVWEEFIWMISWMIPKWFFVELEDTAEWFVEMETADFNEELMVFKWKNQKKYSFWDKIKVRLIEADAKLLRLNFELVE